MVRETIRYAGGSLVIDSDGIGGPGEATLTKVGIEQAEKDRLGLIARDALLTAREIVPVDTGTLRWSLFISEEDEEAFIGSYARHAPIIEERTRFMYLSVAQAVSKYLNKNLIDVPMKPLPIPDAPFPLPVGASGRARPDPLPFRPGRGGL